MLIIEKYHDLNEYYGEYSGIGTFYLSFFKFQLP